MGDDEHGTAGVFQGKVHLALIVLKDPQIDDLVRQPDDVLLFIVFMNAQQYQRLQDLRESQALSETPIVTNQVPYSVASREYVSNGVIPYCQEQGIVVTAYSPVEVGRLDVQRDLEQIAAAHKATPYQIALAWLVQQPWVITIPMSHNPKHLQENWDAAAIVLSTAEMERLNALGG